MSPTHLKDNDVPLRNLLGLFELGDQVWNELEEEVASLEADVEEMGLIEKMTSDEDNQKKKRASELRDLMDEVGEQVEQAINSLFWGAVDVLLEEDREFRVIWKEWIADRAEMRSEKADLEDNAMHLALNVGNMANLQAQNLRNAMEEVEAREAGDEFHDISYRFDSYVHDYMEKIGLGDAFADWLYFSNPDENPIDWSEDEE